MIAELQISQSKIENILNGLRKTAGIEEGYSEDFNLVSLSHANQLKIYVRYFNTVQVLHTIENDDSAGINLDVQSDSEMVFSSDTITKLIKKAGSERLSLKFDDRKFSVETQDSWFTTPTKFTLNMFHESEFQSPTAVSDLVRVTSVDREELIENLKMMAIVSNVVELRLTDSEFWISVSDAVNGEGEVMKKIDDVELEEFEHQYRIETILNFLESVETKEVEVYENPDGILKIGAENPGHTADLMMGARISR